MALKILLADDSMTAQNMGKKILVDAGYDVVAVSNGAAAIKKVAAERPDLAILDVYMPGYTGLEVCERVKASIETQKIPVLLTVGKMEPFNPEEVNRVKADGVMIKPFEASDLIAAVQSIAQRLLAPTPPPKVLDATLKLKGYEDTLRIPPPPGSEPSHAGFDNTVRVPGPKVDHEGTLRLTPEQVKAFQDASYKDWVSTTEPHVDAPEMPAATAVSEVEPEPAMPVIPAMAPEEPAVPAMHFETTPALSRETPVFNAMTASGVGSEMFVEPATPAASITETEDEVPAFYAPLIEPDVQETEAVQVAEPSPVLEEAVVTSLHAAEPEPAIVSPTPVTEAPLEAPIVSIEPVMAEPTVAPVVFVEPEPLSTPAVAEAPVLETSAPKTPEPVFVAQVPEFEATVAPAIEMSVPQAQELEVTSPSQERGTFVAREPELVTSSDDMSEFVTKFGGENAEPVHVGIASDLSAEQLAAITTPIEEPTPEAAHDVPVPAEVVEPIVHTSPIEEVGTITTAPVETSEPVVAYVPGYNDTQTIAPVQDEEPESPVAAVEPSAPAFAIQEPVTQPEAVASISAEEPQPSSVMHAIEAAAAAAVGAATAAGVAHVLHTEPPAVEQSAAPVAEPEPEVHAAPVIEESAPGETVPSEIIPHPPVEAAPVEAPPVQGPIGDAALAEELAAALATKEPEAHAASFAETATAAAAEVPHSVQGITDHKLADAVARAFENLKPQLITEIIKELMR